MAVTSIGWIGRCRTRSVWGFVAACVLGFPLAADAQLIISEYRVRGPNGASDEFVEIYNNSGGNHTVAAISGTGYGLAASNGVTRCTIPNGTVIPNRGHYLCVNSVGYSLAAYAAGNGTSATGDATYTTDIPDNAGVALFNNNTGGASYALANRLDAVGSTSEGNALYKEGAGHPALTPFDINHSFTRRPPGGCTGSSGGGNCNSVALIQTTSGPGTYALQDSNNNAADFMFVDTNGSSAGAGQRLGAPGPENLSSPASSDGFGLAVSRLDSSKPYNVPPNYVRSGVSVPAQNSTFGTLDIRQRFTNTTGGNITRLRFRVLDITTFPSITNVADLRPITSSDLTVSGATVRGTTLEQPPSQPNGSGYNGTLSVGAITPAAPLATGTSVGVRFVLGVQQIGAARFCIVAETLPVASSQVFCFMSPTEGIVRESSESFSSAAAIFIPATGTGAATGAPAAPYPSTITVAGITDPVARVTVTLKQMSHTFPGDIDVLLVGPTGVKFILMSDAIGGDNLTGQTYTFDDSASASLPNSSAPPPSGSLRPTNYGGTTDVFPAPAPAGPYLYPGTGGTSSLASAFNGLNPNGTWSLYVVDDAGVDVGAIAGGWDLTIISSCTAPLGAVAWDFDGDCASDRAVYRPSTGEWFVQNEAVVSWGIPGDIPVAADYSGDGRTDRAVYRPSTGQWWVQGLATVQWGLHGDIPVPGDYNGAGTAERAVYRPATGVWYVRNAAPLAWGLPGDIPVPGDYNGDLTTEIAVYRPSTGQWWVRNQAAVAWGAPGDVPVPGDYDGDGDTDRAVYRPSTGQWWVQGLATVAWGLPGDIPVPGDYDGDGITDRAVYRPTTGAWFVQNQAAVLWGLQGDVPVPRPEPFGDFNADGTADVGGNLGDFDGNGTTDIAVYRPSTGVWFAQSQAPVQWGAPGDIPVPGDYSGTGATDIAVFRPSNGAWFVQGHAPVLWGQSGDIPVPLDYNGDGVTDVAVFRPSTAVWFVQDQSAVQWGLHGDIPVPGDYNGDGLNDIAVYRPPTGQWFVQGQAPVQWGLPGDIAVPGDYNGDGTIDRAVYRPSTGIWWVQGQAAVPWGLPGDIPVPGDFNGDGVMDRAVFRPSNGTWFVHGQSAVQFGLDGDLPASHAYVPR